MKKINIAIGSDHAGYELKQRVIEMHSSKYNFINFGTNTSESVDYPIYGHKVGISVSKAESLIGIVICGSGIGISISANKESKSDEVLQHCVLTFVKEVEKLNFKSKPDY